MAGLVLAAVASVGADQLAWDPGHQFEASAAAVGDRLAGASATEESHPSYVGRDPVQASADLRSLDWLVAVGADWAGFVEQGGSEH